MSAASGALRHDESDDIAGHPAATSAVATNAATPNAATSKPATSRTEGDRERVRANLVDAPSAAGLTQAIRGVPGLRSDAQRWTLLRRAAADMAGLGPLQRFIEDPRVTDVLVNAPRSAWVDRGNGLVQVAAPDLHDVRELATLLAAAAGQRLDDAAPIVEGRLPDGTRLHAVLAPVAADGAMISLRTFRRRAMSLTDLRALGFVDSVGYQVLERLVSVRANVMVSGATGAGKTTLLASLLSLVPHSERIVCIEEAVELTPDHPHVVHLQVRRPNVEGAGAIGLDDLVRTAMRMRPDRLVLGECRGAEVREVLGALNTGHEGGWATVHANAALDVPARLVALGALARMDPQTVAVQAVSALDAIVHIRRDRGQRRLEQIAVLGTDDHGRLTSRVAMHTREGQLQPAEAWSELAARLDRA